MPGFYVHPASMTECHPFCVRHKVSCAANTEKEKKGFPKALWWLFQQASEGPRLRVVGISQSVHVKEKSGFFVFSL